MKLDIHICRVAQKHHDRSLRQYAHVLHHPGKICVAEEFWLLSEKHLLGILAHEVGHVLAHDDGLASTEAQADAAALMQLGIKIHYKDSIYGERLQYLTARGMDRFYEVLRLKDTRLTLR